MRAKWFLALVGLATLSGSVSAKAKHDLSYERQIMFDYAKCVVKRKHGLAVAAILANANNQQIQENYQALIIGDCLVSAVGDGGVQMSFGGDLYRYALADALVNADLSDVDFANFDDRAKLTHFEMPDHKQLEADLASVKSKRRKAEIQRKFDQQVVYVFFSRFGECVARKDPANSKKWLLIKPTAVEEAEPIRALQPAFNACLLGIEKLGFNRTSMRGLLAVNYYRLAKAPVIATGGAQH